MSNGVELSERELEILRLVATGASNKEIALRLAISPNTVKVHLRNIFNKIGVVSRTEATLYAMRHGLVQPPGQPLSSRAVGSSQLSVDEPIPGSPLSRAPISISIPDEPSTRKKDWQTLVAGRRGRWLLITGAVLVFTAALLVVFELSSRLTPSTPRSTQATTPEAVVDRWQARAVLPIKAKGVALAVYENELYAIGGETGIGVSRKVNRFSLDGGSWNECAEKPTAVAYAQAALVGEKIYVPGGRLASGKPTAALEVYDPRRDLWETKADMPTAISGYALAAFEGRLYLFGGWDGALALDEVYMYDPIQDTWTARTAMPAARAYAGAAATSGKIFVIGGFDGQQALAVNQVYYPDRDGSGESPWGERAALSEGRYAMGIATLADFIYILGGITNAPGEQQALQYVIQQDTWQTFENPPSAPGDYLTAAAAQDQIVLIGGETNGTLSGQHQVYQAIYKVLMPALEKSENQP